MALVRLILGFFLVIFGIFAAMGLMLLGFVARIFGHRPAVPTRPTGPTGPNQNQRSPQSEARPVAPSFARGDIIDIESKPVKE